MTHLEVVLAECAAHDIRLSLGDNDKLIVDAPPGVLTSERVRNLRESKSALLQALRASDAAAPEPTTTVPTIRCARCRSVEWVDYPIHEGRSVRRDCANCNFTIDFPVWHPNDSSPKT